MNEVRHRPWMCGKCGYLMDTSTSVTDPNAVPKNGSISMCLNCGAVLLMRNNKWINAAKAQLNALPADIKSYLFKLDYFRRFVVNTDLNKPDHRKPN